MDSKNATNKNWIKVGLAWGAIMFVIMEIAYPLINSKEITLQSITVGIVLWTLGGLSFGITMRKVKDD